ncbi:hypothetical protein [Polaribacter glomeratus]|uniref:Uncharacterized protein n=1 Tax=Polaribacter glomeratus TaxID=102 RepID=A0A2S7WG01_9FLAO|nr:hypothetical protein [Polaribacter glomeratus]PQJ76530.1 hypothetical protein BTO16_11535 [Polaribacter glomeratus]TXD64166.1 hypothetical protein ESX12_15760 [Polaribacter glomeratus]
MGRLKKRFQQKIVASSLTEVIVATSILLVVFAIALLTLNNLMVSTLQTDTQKLDTEIEILIYKYQNNQLKTPSSIQEGSSIIDVQRINKEDIDFVEFSIKDENSNKTKSKKIIAISNEE